MAYYSFIKKDRRAASLFYFPIIILLTHYYFQAFATAFSFDERGW